MEVGNTGRRLFAVILLVLCAASAAPSCETTDRDDGDVEVACTEVVDLSAVLNSTPGKSVVSLNINQSPHLKLTAAHFLDTPLAALMHLDLSKNQLTSFTSEPLGALTDLVVLKLSKNNLTEIAADTFEGLSSVKHLILSDNFIASIHASALQPLKNLTDLDLRDNHLTTIPPGLFQGTNVRSLNLEDNLLSTIPEGVFVGADHLENIILGDNAITSIHHDAFHNLREVRFLDLSGNRLSGLDARLFASSPLLALDLTDNRIKSLDNFPLNCSTLMGLRLSENQISSVPPDYLRSLPSLVVLIVSDNNISTLAPGLLDNNTRIMKLYLNNNQMESLTVASFRQIARVLKTETADIVADLKQVLGPSTAVTFQRSEVSLRGNPWNCASPDMRELQTWADENDVPFQDLFSCDA